MVKKLITHIIFFARHNIDAMGTEIIFFLKLVKIMKSSWLLGSVVDPDPKDPNLLQDLDPKSWFGSGAGSERT